METTYQIYLDTREEIFKGRKDKFICLMDLALMAMRKLKKEGKLEDMEVSDEINACSVIVPVEMDYGDRVERMASRKSGLYFLKTKPITILPRLSLSAVRQPVLGARSAILFPGGAMCIRRCV